MLFEFLHNIQQSTFDAMSSAIVVSTCDWESCYCKLRIQNCKIYSL